MKVLKRIVAILFVGLMLIGPFFGANAAETTTRGNFADPTFKLETGNFSPTTKQYTSGTKRNFESLLGSIGRYLLIGVTTFAVLSITIGGVMIATTGPSDRHAKGKTIISLNIMAIILALLSYSIVQFVRWVLSV